MKRHAAAIAAALLVSASPARAQREKVDELALARVVFTRGGSLWQTDARGKGPAVEIAKLPAAAQTGSSSTVRAVRSDRRGRVIVVDVGGRWYWARLAAGENDAAGDGASAAAPAAAATTPPALVALPCGGAVRIAAEGDAALCTGNDGRSALFRFGAAKATPLPVPAGAAAVRRAPVSPVVKAASSARPAAPITEAARLMQAASVTFALRPALSPPAGPPPPPPPPRPVPPAPPRELVWADASGVWMAPLDKPSARRQVAPAPLRHFLAAPDASRGVGIYHDTATSHGKTVERDLLFGFALDGKGVRRKAIRDGVPVDWSWDSKWVLVQSGATACLMRAVGGEYKCWKGYTAVSIAPDGAWALLLGHRGGDDKGERDRDRDGGGEAEIEGAGPGDGPDDPEVSDVADEAISLPSGPLSLYRARLAGAYTEKPSLVERVVEGAALWLPTSAP